MKNFIQPGAVLTLLAAAVVLSGEAVLVGKIFGVALSSVAAGASGEFQTEGVHELPVLSTDVVTVGAPLYWDVANKRLTVTVASNTRVGVATVAKAAGGLTALLKIDAVII